MKHLNIQMSRILVVFLFVCCGLLFFFLQLGFVVFVFVFFDLSVMFYTSNPKTCRKTLCLSQIKVLVLYLQFYLLYSCNVFTKG